MLTAALFTTAKIWKQPKCPSKDEWTEKWCICTMDYDSAIKKNEILPSAATWTDPEGTVQSEVSQTKGHMPYDFTSMWNQKHKNEQAEQKQT